MVDAVEVEEEAAHDVVGAVRIAAVLLGEAVQVEQLAVPALVRVFVVAVLLVLVVGDMSGSRVLHGSEPIICYRFRH
jgi:hypothetical protein